MFLVSPVWAHAEGETVEGTSSSAPKAGPVAQRSSVTLDGENSGDMKVDAETADKMLHPNWKVEHAGEAAEAAKTAEPAKPAKTAEPAKSAAPSETVEPAKTAELPAPGITAKANLDAGIQPATTAFRRASGTAFRRAGDRDASPKSSVIGATADFAPGHHSVWGHQVTDWNFKVYPHNPSSDPGDSLKQIRLKTLKSKGKLTDKIYAKTIQVTIGGKLYKVKPQVAEQGKWNYLIFSLQEAVLLKDVTQDSPVSIFFSTEPIQDPNHFVEGSEWELVVESPGKATIQVHVAGDLAANGSFTPLSGATLKLQANNAGKPGDVVKTCESDGNGLCVFENVAVPGGGSKFFVSEKEAPDGWRPIKELTVHFMSRKVELLPYAYETPVIKPGDTVTSGKGSFMTEGSYEVVNNPWNGYHPKNPNWQYSSSGHMMFARNNPVLTNKCGLRIQLMVDQSTSMATPPEFLGALSKSLIDFLNFVKDSGVSGSTVGLSFFDEGVHKFSDPVDLKVEENSTKLTEKIKEWANRYDQHWHDEHGHGTNWDAAFRSLAGESYDAVLFVTDGASTYYSNGTSRGGGNGVTGDFNIMERAIASANLLKSKTRVFMLGVGDFNNYPAFTANFNAVSGVNAAGSQDQQNWFTLGDKQLAQVMHNIALAGCSATVTVQKELAEAGSTQPGGAGWNFTGAANVGGSASTSEAVTNDYSLADFQVPLEGSQNGSITITEKPTASQQQDGWKMSKVSCKDGDALADMSFDSTHKAFTVSNLRRGQRVLCTVTNSRNLIPIDIQVYKKGPDIQPLAGAEFRLDPDPVNGAPGAVVTTGDNGLAPAFTNLKTGDYKLIEVKAPAGHSLMAVPIGIKVSRNAEGVPTAVLKDPVDAAIAKIVVDPSTYMITIHVEDQLTGGQLPHTGGIGIYWFFMLGGFAIAGGAVFLQRKIAGIKTR